MNWLVVMWQHRFSLSVSVSFESSLLIWLDAIALTNTALCFYSFKEWDLNILFLEDWLLCLKSRKFFLCVTIKVSFHKLLSTGFNFYPTAPSMFNDHEKIACDKKKYVCAWTMILKNVKFKTFFNDFSSYYTDLIKK